MAGGGQGGARGSLITIDHRVSESPPGSSRHVAFVELTQDFSSAPHGWHSIGQEHHTGPYSQVRPARAGSHAPSGFASGQVSGGGMGGAMGGGIGGGVGDGSIVFSARPRWASSESMLWVSAEPVLWPSSAASTNTLSMALVEPTCCRIAFLLLEHICNTAEGFTYRLITAEAVMIVMFITDALRTGVGG